MALDGSERHILRPFSTVELKLGSWLSSITDLDCYSSEKDTRDTVHIGKREVCVRFYIWTSVCSMDY